MLDVDIGMADPVWPDPKSWEGEGAKTVVLTCETKWSKYERGG